MFEGFSQETVDFMWGIRFNNERPWFEAHKGDYQTYFLNPMKELGNRLQAALLDKFPESGLNLKVSRIYRDARRLFGRGPYKDHLWFSLQRGENAARGPMFWFELGLQGSSHGLGFWDETPGQAALFRKGIDADPARFERLARGIPQRERCRLWGDEYKRPKGERGPLLNPWYNRKGHSVGYESLFGQELFSPRLPELLADSFAGLLELYAFFLEVWQASDEKPDLL